MARHTARRQNVDNRVVSAWSRLHVVQSLVPASAFPTAAGELREIERLLDEVIFEEIEVPESEPSNG